MKTTTRTNDSNPTENYTETTTGDAPSSVEVSLTAKGQLQWSIKLYYPTPANLCDFAAADLIGAESAVEDFAHERGYTMAGK